MMQTHTPSRHNAIPPEPAGGDAPRSFAWVDRRGAGDLTGSAGHATPPSLFRPAMDPAPTVQDVLLEGLPDLLHATGVLRAQAGWLADSLDEAGTRLPDAVRALMRQAARLQSTMGTLIAIAGAKGTARYEEGVDPNAILAALIGARCAGRPGAVDFLSELPVCATDVALFQAIGGALLDAGLGAARRSGDVIGLRAIRAGETLRLTVVFPGPPVAESDRAALFTGKPGPATPAASALALALLWQAVALLEGQIEVGDGPRGTGLRITVILPFLAPLPGEDRA